MAVGGQLPHPPILSDPKSMLRDPWQDLPSSSARPWQPSSLSTAGTSGSGGRGVGRGGGLAPSLSYQPLNLGQLGQRTAGSQRSESTDATSQLSLLQHTGASSASGAYSSGVNDWGTSEWFAGAPRDSLDELKALCKELLVEQQGLRSQLASQSHVVNQLRSAAKRAGPGGGGALRGGGALGLGLRAGETPGRAAPGRHQAGSGRYSHQQQRRTPLPGGGARTVLPAGQPSDLGGGGRRSRGGGGGGGSGSGGRVDPHPASARSSSSPRGAPGLSFPAEPSRDTRQWGGGAGGGGRPWHRQQGGGAEAAMIPLQAHGGAGALPGMLGGPDHYSEAGATVPQSPPRSPPIPTHQPNRRPPQGPPETADQMADQGGEHPEPPAPAPAPAPRSEIQQAGVGGGRASKIPPVFLVQKKG